VTNSIEIICATRFSEDEFWRGAALGQSLKRLSYYQKLVHRIAFNNKTGLPTVYNSAAQLAHPDSVLVFIHDDVWLEDIFLPSTLAESLAAFDIVGVAGNLRRQPFQPAWAFQAVPTDSETTSLVWDEPKYLSGAVAHGQQPFSQISYFGEAKQSCELLDGVLLCVKKAIWISRRLRFDERFEFHFYDMDFCRSARQSGARLGTWPISITHQSGGSFGADAWLKCYQLYVEKWRS
jgi:GT2 family glycosyltransferase